MKLAYSHFNPISAEELLTMLKTIHDLLIGNLWQPRKEQIKKLHEQFELPAAKLNSLKTTPKIANPNPVTIIPQHNPIAPAQLTIHNEVSPITIPSAIIPPTVQKQVPAKFINKTEVAPTNKPLSNKPLIADWHTLQNSAVNCEECNLWQHRTHVVLERGNREAKWMFIGDWPSEQDDLHGKPMQANSGELLDKMIAAMQLDVENDVYITNIIKCRPAGTRKPISDEINHCSNYLFSQINLIKPKIIITLGSDAAQALLQRTTAINKLRQQVHYYQDIPLIVTYHPADLLRTPHLKKGAWEDLQLALSTFKQLS